MNFPKDFYEYLRQHTLIGIKGGKDRATFLNIWAVEVEGRMFARSWNKSERSWFTALISSGEGQIKYGDKIIDIWGSKLENKPELNQRINDAYLAKYTQQENLHYAKGITQPAYENYTVELFYRPETTQLISFAHTNIITDNWKRLADFYIDVFGCRPVYPERDISGEWLDNATGIKDAHIRGIHLALPGYGENAPTLEVFEYDSSIGNGTPLSNTRGFNHIAFRVGDVKGVLQRLLAKGGSQVGEVVEADIEDVGKISFVYARDIDGNIIELQSWQ